jgi:hypothetical protein
VFDVLQRQVARVGITLQPVPVTWAAMQTVLQEKKAQMFSSSWYADLPDAQQLAFLKGIEQTPFFGRMRFLTVLGLLALPSYGGNREKSGWKMVGFVDQHAWEPPFGYYDVDYPGFQPYPKERQS